MTRVVEAYLAESVLPSGELDPESYWQVLCNLLSSVLKSSHVPSSAVYCLGLSVQRNTFLLWDSFTCCQFVFQALNKTGKVLYKIVPCTKFKLASHFKLTCIFVVTRLAHMFDEDPTLGISPIIMNLVEMSPKIFPAICPTSHRSELTTCLFLISTFYGEVRFGPLGRSPEELAAGIKRVRVTALIGDSQAAMLGEGCLNRGDAKLTLGTGAFLNVNIGSKAIPPKTGFYPVIGWAQSVRSNAEESCERIADTKLSNVTYLLEGFNSDAGNTLTRLKDSGKHSWCPFKALVFLNLALRITHKPLFFLTCDFPFFMARFDAIEEDATPFFVPSSLGFCESRKMHTQSSSPEKALTFVNTNSVLTEGGVFVGLPAGFDQKALQKRVRKAAIFAVMDSIALSARLLIRSANTQLTSNISVLRVNGNLTRSDWLMQRLANTLNLPVERSAISETCCLGAAIAAGVGAGIWASYADAVSRSRPQSTLVTGVSECTNSPQTLKTRFTPNPKCARRMDVRYTQWTSVCARVLKAHNADCSATCPPDSITLNFLLKCIK
ncbi:unnamed protein product [Mesocestoides corti]|uniref:Carbohydrate kinase FGGY C-terminal domain-containing protein n=1 Tax=Mesocestoides corti TaxID=53468 RepID=A0A0R3UMM3_MESCO|nr:unnamed protein product [Mesocestoides corti]